MGNETASHALVLPLDSPEATLAVVGGKAINLVRLTRAGFRVPTGFIVTTRAYRAHVDAGGLDAGDLDAMARRAVAGVDPSNAAGLEDASRMIRTAFASRAIPSGVERDIRAAYGRLCEQAEQHEFGRNQVMVAVRSSATAEDLADVSFAGQQDTYLGVVGADAVVAAVRDCWASLWTARAIGYRVAAGLEHDDAALAVIVQRMVAAEASGVMFTADPVTGHRGRIVIDATRGLGEALVSGQVEPDHFVVHRATGAVLSRSLGPKATTTTLLPGGGVQTHTGEADERFALTDSETERLAQLGTAIHREYGAPQDIEWALADAEFSVLQSRPVTSLFPLPDGHHVPGEHTRAHVGADDQELRVWFSFGAVQGMLDPITPLGRDALRLILSGVATVMGRPDIDYRDLAYLDTAGERLWIRIDELLRHPVGRRIGPRVFSFVEPGSTSMIEELLDHPGLQPRRCTARAAVAFAKGPGAFMRLIAPRIIAGLRDPESLRVLLERAADDLVASAQSRQGAAGALREPGSRLAVRADAARQAARQGFPTLIPAFAPIMLPSLVLWRAIAAAAEHLDRLTPADPPAAELALEITRALPGNVTTQMDLDLWSVARSIRDDPDSLSVVSDSEPEELAGALAQGGAPQVLAGALRAFLEVYGARGTAEIDLGRPRWREDPTALLATLRGYLMIDSAAAPDVVFARGELAAQAATAVLVARARTVAGPASPLLARGLSFAISRFRSLMGARETPKFTMIRALGEARQGLLASGEELVSLGFTQRADDLFYLELDELDALARDVTATSPRSAGTTEAGRVAPTEPTEPTETTEPTESIETTRHASWRELCANRRAAYDREKRRAAVPRLLIGDGRAYYGGASILAGVGSAGSVDGGKNSNVMAGSGVSPGVVEAVVRVVRDPADATLQQGEILVCLGTDPAWTPLFLLAAGLVTEVGGMMTHGSVVAREYGIPAVVGVHSATTLLTTGTRIRLDGAAGTIDVL